MTESAPLIRPFVPADQAATRRLLLEGLGEHFGQVDETCNPDIDDIAANYADRGHLFLVAQASALIVGAGALIFEEGDVGRLVRVSVAHPWRRQGLARALVMRLIAAGRAHGLVRLWMETNDDWTAAISLYQGCGFVAYDRRAGNIYMALDLSRNPTANVA